MNDPLSRGLAFEVGDLWRKSAFDQVKKENSIFDALEPNLPALKTGDGNTAHFAFDIDLSDLPWPDDLLPEANSLEDIEDARPNEAASLEIWDLDVDHDRAARFSDFRTWEGFGHQDLTDTATTSYLSEAGPQTFDAALQTVAKSIGVLPQDFVLRALSGLALGRSSSLFRWSTAGNQFEQNLEGAAISGISLPCSNDFVANLKDMGDSMVRLRTFSDPSRAIKEDGPALMALRSCTSSVLNAIDETVAPALSRLSSLLQLQELTRQSHSLLKMLSSMVEATKGLKTDEAVISSISDGIHAGAEVRHQFCSVFQCLLARIAFPWLESMAADLGLGRPKLDWYDETENTSVDGTDQNKLTFLELGDERLIRETKAAILLLRQEEPRHPLLYNGEARQSRFAEVISGGVPSTYCAERYEAEMTEFLKQNAFTSSSRPATHSEPSAADVPGAVLWQDETSAIDYITDMEALMSKRPDQQHVGGFDALNAETLAALRDPENDAETTGTPLEALVTISPIDQVRPLIKTQHKLVNAVLMRQLLRNHKLRQHLELQRSFQLLGNGKFLTRLSTALFSKDVQSAERKRGVVPTAEEIGLRVGSSKDQRWPPASSELQLTLMGLLNEANGSVGHDRLSFAIRELPEEEIDRVLDPHSIYALDFLRLQYAAHAPLDAVITSESLIQYDAVFRYLLKLLRLTHVTSSMSRKAGAHNRDEPRDRNTLVFMQQAQYFISRLWTHIMDMGIRAPWRELMNSFASLERSLAEEDKNGKLGRRVGVGIQGLRQLHEECLDRIRSRLFLKRKHAKLYAAVEGVFCAILKPASVLQTGSVSTVEEDDLVAFRKSLSHLLRTLEQFVNKPLKSVAAADTEDTGLMKMLLLSLNWNEYYDPAKPHTTT
jgi:hypothetical protein